MNKRQWKKLHRKQHAAVMRIAKNIKNDKPMGMTLPEGWFDNRVIVNKT